MILISVLDLLVAGRARPRLPRAGLLLLRRLRRHLPRRLTEAAQGANEQVAKYNLDKVIAPKHSHSLFFRNEARQEAGDRVPEAGPAQGVSEATAAAGDDAEAAQDPPRPQGGFALRDYDLLSPVLSILTTALAILPIRLSDPPSGRAPT